DVAERRYAMLDPVAGCSDRVIERRGAHMNVVTKREGDNGAEILKSQLRRQLLERNGECRLAHLRGEDFLDPAKFAQMPRHHLDADVGPVNRCEEGEAVDVIPMRV